MRLVPNEEIGEKDYNIAVSSYVEQRDEREEIDIKKLNAEIARIVTRQSELRTQIDAIVTDLDLPACRQAGRRGYRHDIREQIKHHQPG